jgi:DNA-binding winged helix-turn-helix (wHTH) protein/tetratricopeptide (TPR) repeat protein
VVKPSDLATREDVRVGPLEVSPSRRRVAGPGGEAQLEPVIMQVFLVLLDSRDRVVTRQELFDAGWGGVVVGDDSLNRAIGKIRRIGEQAAPGLFKIETIPRTGYRLISHVQPIAATSRGQIATGSISRRKVIVGGLAAGAVAVGLWAANWQKDREFSELMARGKEALEYGDPSAEPADHFRRAVLMRPQNAQAQGLLAYALALRATFEPGAGRALEEAHRAARTALDLEEKEPNALVAQTLILRSMLDFGSTEDRLRQVLDNAPENTGALRQLWNVMQCVGRSRDALSLIERALEVKPLGASNNFPRAQLLWILGRNAEADRVIDRAIQYWPEHRNVRFARFMIFAFTGRPGAALSMLAKNETRPQSFSPMATDLWRVTLKALDEGSPATISAARSAAVVAAKENVQLSSQAIMTLSVLGDVDAAFEVTNAHFALGRASERRELRDKRRGTSTAWRFAPWLFIPPTAALRADPPFQQNLRRDWPYRLLGQSQHQA